MASVSSLDKDLRRMRRDKFTPAAANEARAWIEERLGHSLPSPDLLDGLKDGVALCRLVNLAVPPPGVKYKQSAMPFVQMENISHFLAACQAPPLNLHQHDTFLTVDLYEQKDPAQVLQCLGAFSRAANAVNPANFPTTIGPKTRTGGMSPQATGPPVTPTALRDRGASFTSNASSAYTGPRPVLLHRTGDSPSRLSPTKGHAKSPSNGGSPGPVSSWSRKEQEGATSPAWNIAQYGYMGGASQGNLGISFGGRRQITGAAPSVPSLAEKERRRKEDEERQRLEADEEERRRRAEAEQEEEQRWEQETERLRDEERRKADEEKRQWEEQERQWKLTEQKRRQEEHEAQARLDEERRRFRSQGDVRLRGQFLSHYRADSKADAADADNRHSSRVKELEKELELARQREAEYERDRQQRLSRTSSRPTSQTATPPPPPAASGIRPEPAPAAAAPSPAPAFPARAASWSKGEREFLHTQCKQHQESEPEPAPTAAPEPDDQPPAVTSPRPLPEPGTTPSKAGTPSSVDSSSSSSRRPLPDPAKYGSPPASLGSRTGRLAASLSSLSVNSSCSSTTPPASSQSRGGSAKSAWASKSLLEREMELERQRQREWEEAQRETAKAVPAADGVDGIGGRWDVGQWAGYTGGDSQNRGSHGIGAGRRQIVGPRPLPGPNR